MVELCFWKYLGTFQILSDGKYSDDVLCVKLLNYYSCVWWSKIEDYVYLSNSLIVNLSDQVW